LGIFLALLVFSGIYPVGIMADDTESSRIRIKPFELSQVRLLDSPFKDAQDKDAKYLLSVNADSLLAKFRINAGLEAKAKHYDGWEKDSIAGHSLGHYLSAVAMMYAATGDERFKERADYIVNELDECQKAGKDGLISAIPNDRKVFAEIRYGEIRSQGFDLNGLWVPWYALHKQYAGLIDAYHHCGNDKALEVAKKFGDWAIDVTANLTDEQFAQMMRCEFGGMNDVLYQLYRITGEGKYRKLADRFYDAVILEPFAEGRDVLPGRHGNTQFPKVIGLAQSYELTGHEKHRRITEFFWDCVANHHTYATGGNTMNEHFGPPDKLNDRLDGNTTETCNTYNMLKMTRHLYTWTGDTKYLDYYERGLYNHILASIDRSDDMNKLFTYFVPLRSGGYRTYSTAFDNWTCCHGTGMENHAKYGDSIYFHATEDGKDVLYINLPIPSTLDWKEKGIKVELRSYYHIIVTAERPTPLVIKLRFPRNTTLRPHPSFDDKEVVQEGGYLVYERMWYGSLTGMGGSSFNFIPAYTIEPMPDNKNRVAFFKGPILMAGNLGTIDVPLAGRFESAGKENVSIPFFVGHFDTPSDVIRNFDFQNHLIYHFDFTLKTIPRETRMIPFYDADNRYSVYFDVYSEAEWKELQMAHLAEQARLQTLERLTVDFFQPGEMQPERDHNFRGENSAFGEAFGRKWRHAFGGGSMTFEMKLNPAKKNKLVLTYWGSDSGNRVFDVLVEGKKIATQRLDNNAPEQFFDVEHLLDDEAFRELEKITVTLKAHPGATAGGFFGCRTMIVEE
jgi:DUF1680 family protein